MIDHFPFYLSLVIAIVLLIMLAKRIRVAYPILLVLAGLLIGFIPGTPSLHIDPDLIFVIFLPPLLYEAAWNISLKELWHWRRIITSFAFLVVFITALSVALVANAFIPGFTIALGFLLGGIVSPPDAVSTGAIIKFVKLPKAMVSILEGESLLNDASSLIIFRFALIAIGTGQFVWQTAAFNFVWMVIGGIAAGLLVGIIFIKIHKFLPTDANMDILLTIVTPYVMYFAAEELRASGVLAVVSGGLLLSSRQHLFLSSTSRLKGFNVWESLVFVLNGLVFLLIGLSLPEITSGLEGISLSTAIGYGILISAVLIIGRILMAYGAVVTTLVARNFITVAEGGHPGWRGPFALGWAGMRGVVSLAAALSIPVTVNGIPFPQRNLILFITFIVILTTLVLQGLTLPWVIRKLKLPERPAEFTEDEVHEQIKKGMAQHAWNHLQKQYPAQLENSLYLQQLAEKWKGKITDTTELTLAAEVKSVYIDLLNQQRKWLLETNRKDPHLDDQIIRKQLHLIDIETEKVKHM